jgi:hypothetical protein
MTDTVGARTAICARANERRATSRTRRRHVDRLDRLVLNAVLCFCFVCASTEQPTHFALVCVCVSLSHIPLALARSKADRRVRAVRAAQRDAASGDRVHATLRHARPRAPRRIPGFPSCFFFFAVNLWFIFVFLCVCSRSIVARRCVCVCRRENQRTGSLRLICSLVECDYSNKQTERDGTERRRAYGRTPSRSPRSPITSSQPTLSYIFYRTPAIGVCCSEALLNMSSCSFVVRR